MQHQLIEISQQSSREHAAILASASRQTRVQVYEVDPLKDRRWNDLVQWHPHASIFHSVGWLDSLSRTYGYEPVVYTTSSPTSELENGLLFCRIRSWATGNRIVSLPFSDHCAPLCDPGEEFDRLIQCMHTDRIRQEWDYLEVRPVGGNFENSVRKRGFKSAGKYVLHRVELEPTPEELFQRLHKNSVQRRVRHAERVGVVEVCGKSQKLLKEFYWLLVRTRARQSLPPQPYSWFKNLVDRTGDAMDLRLAYMGNVPVAAVMVLHFKDTSYYKYGCSDERFHNLGAMPFLLWRALLHAKSIGSKTLDLGRTEDGHRGLIAFKNHWAPVSESLTYWTFPSKVSLTAMRDWKLTMVNRICAHMPHRVLAAAGSLIYRHAG
jgi:hypothetical protein